MLSKLKNNNKGGADLQFAISVFLFMFVVCMALLVDFWFVSSAKISVLKAVQQVELYCLVKNAPKGNELGGNDASADYSNMYTADLSTNQALAVGCSDVDLPGKMAGFPYISEYTLSEPISGLSDHIGQMGVRIRMKYKVKTMLRSPEQIFGFMTVRNGENKVTDDDIDAKNWVPLTVTTKLVPIITDKSVSSGK